MHIPAIVEKLRLELDWDSWGPYPPLGFAPFPGCEFGNGDMFGLYWPFGQEDQEPVICEMNHDGYVLVPAFPELGSFVAWAEEHDWQWSDYSELDFEDWCVTSFRRGRAAISSGDVSAAIDYLRKAAQGLPDVAEYWFHLAMQLRRSGDRDGFEVAILNAVRSNWAFGLPPRGTMRAVQQIRAEGPCGTDPLRQIAGSLSLSFGGTKHNEAYPLLRQCITAYREQGKWRHAAVLHQSNGWAMYRETTAFQERYEWESASWKSELVALCSEGLQSTRYHQG